MGSTQTIKTFGDGKITILAYDFGMKYNIIRYFVREHKVKLVVVPFDYDLKNSKIEWDGLFLSNGPGDPAKVPQAIESIKYAITLEEPKPVFGICLGNQLLALASGAKTY